MRTRIALKMGPGLNQGTKDESLIETCIDSGSEYGHGFEIVTGKESSDDN